MGSTWKNCLAVSIFGQSHGAAVGVTLDGVPAGEDVDFAALEAFMLRRAPGRFPWATPRKEADKPEFLSGIVNGKTCGAPITAIISNTNTRPRDYVKNIPRPGHADFAAIAKHGMDVDLSGGGHFSGRLTAGLCIAGGICLQILQKRGIFIAGHVATVGGVWDTPFHNVNIGESEMKSLWTMPIPVLNPQTATLIIKEIERVKQANDSIGGTVECVAIGLPAGLGSPLFGGMENRISQLVFAIPAVKGIEFGAGFAAAAMRGSENNDPFCITENKIKTTTNNHGGILGGITTGMPLIFRAAVKPTPSIGKAQQSVDLTAQKPATLEIKGRHDPCIVPRAVPCFEAALAIAIYDAMLE